MASFGQSQALAIAASNPECLVDVIPSPNLEPGLLSPNFSQTPMESYGYEGGEAEAGKHVTLWHVVEMAEHSDAGYLLPPNVGWNQGLEGGVGGLWI